MAEYGYNGGPEEFPTRAEQDMTSDVMRIAEEAELALHDELDRIQLHGAEPEVMREFLETVVGMAYREGYRAGQQKQSEGDERWKR